MELKKNFYFPLLAFLIIFTALFAWLGFYNWPHSGDDFNFATRVSQTGFWEFQKDFFLHDNGRLANAFFLSLCVSFPFISSYRFWALITILTYAFCVWIFLGILPPPTKSHEKIKSYSL